MLKEPTKAETLAQISRETDPAFMALANIKDGTALAIVMSETYTADTTDADRFKSQLLNGAAWRYAGANGWLKAKADKDKFATLIGLSISQLYLYARLYDGKPIMVDAAEWYMENRANLVRTVAVPNPDTQQSRDVVVGFIPRKGGVEWQVAVNDAYAMYSGLIEASITRSAMSHNEAIAAVRMEYERIPTPTSKAQKLAKLVENVTKAGIKVVVDNTTVEPVAEPTEQSEVTG